MNFPIITRQEEAYRVFVKYGYKFVGTDLLITNEKMSERDILEVEACGWEFNTSSWYDPEGYFRPYGCRIIDYEDFLNV
jgi:hypothetical protein